MDLTETMTFSAGFLRNSEGAGLSWRGLQLTSHMVLSCGKLLNRQLYKESNAHSGPVFGEKMLIKQSK